MAKRPHNFGVIDGGKSQGNPSTSKVAPPSLTVIAAKQFADAKQTVHEMGNAFINAYNANMRVFAVLYCSHDNSFTYASSNNEDSFIPYAIGSDDTPLKLKALLYTDIPFEQQLPVKYTNNAQSIDDILRAFEQIAEDNNENNPYGFLPEEITRPAQRPDIYIDDIKSSFLTAQETIKKISDEYRVSSHNDEWLVYIFQNKDGEVTQGLLSSNTHEHREKINDFLKSDEQKLIAVLDPKSPLENQWSDKLEHSDQIDPDILPVIPNRVALWVNGKKENLLDKPSNVVSLPPHFTHSP